jgi:mono/diheme cytochrome c family protein
VTLGRGKLADVRRAALIVVVGALLAGCGGEETTAPLPETVEGGTTPTQTETGTTTEPAAQGDPEAGRQVYTANDCGSCHTFEPAGSTGTTGPNLDELPDLAENAGKDLEEFTRESIENPNAYVEEGFPEGIMPAYDQLSDKELTDLVAFLTQA